LGRNDTYSIKYLGNIPLEQINETRRIIQCRKNKEEEMSAPLSTDLRKRILAAKEEGASHAKIAREMRVSVSAITQLLALYRETGSHEPRPNPNGRKPALSAEQLEGIRQKIGAQPDITLRELIEVFSLPVSPHRLG
jgi:transposase-like protein